MMQVVSGVRDAGSGRPLLTGDLAAAAAKIHAANLLFVHFDSNSATFRFENIVEHGHGECQVHPTLLYKD